MSHVEKELHRKTERCANSHWNYQVSYEKNDLCRTIGSTNRHTTIVCIPIYLYLCNAMGMLFILSIVLVLVPNVACVYGFFILGAKFYRIKLIDLKDAKNNLRKKLFDWVRGWGLDLNLQLSLSGGGGGFIDKREHL